MPQLVWADAENEVQQALTSDVTLISDKLFFSLSSEVTALLLFRG